LECVNIDLVDIYQHHAVLM